MTDNYDLVLIPSREQGPERDSCRSSTPTNICTKSGTCGSGTPTPRTVISRAEDRRRRVRLRHVTYQGGTCPGAYCWWAVPTGPADRKAHPGDVRANIDRAFG